MEGRCVWCVVQLLVLLWVSHFWFRFVGRVVTLVRLLVTGVLRVLRQWLGPLQREPRRQVAPGRVRAGLGAEDFQGGGVLFLEMCPCRWPVPWNYVPTMPVYHCWVQRLWSLLCLWCGGGCFTVVRRRLCRHRLHVWCRLQWGGLSGHVPVAVFKGRDCARYFRALGVAVKPQRFCNRGWRGGSGLGVVSGVVQEELPFTLARVHVHAITRTRLRWLTYALLRLSRIAVLASVSVCADALWCRGFGCHSLWWLLNGSAHSRCKVRKGPHCPQGLGEFALGAALPRLLPAAVAVTVTVAGAVSIGIPA